MPLHQDFQFDTIAKRLLNKREMILEAFESFETLKAFERQDWPYKEQGGGQMAVLRGDIFEKAAVNFSCIHGSCFPMNDDIGPFSATGVSLITHMKNPHVPTAHFNVRLLKTDSKYWIGGGFDLTPMADIDPLDIAYFHSTAKSCLDSFDEELYPLFKKQADEYFYIPHRKKTRGVGGIFFDHFSFGDLEKDLLFLEAIADSFLEALLPIIQKYQAIKFTDHDKQKQNQLRAHYVEFNLLYDRGTKFGFLSGGNPEAILCSMPPIATW
jgi:coproporphyrinogen III oxidase